MGAFRFSVGHKGVSRCTVFERPDATSIYIEWWDDDGRHKAALSKVIGHPVTDREKAKDIAREMSRRQEMSRNAKATELLGLPTAHTLSELLDKRHANLGPRWSAKYAKSRERRREFWLHECRLSWWAIRARQRPHLLEEK